MHFFRQFKDRNSGRKHGSQTNDPIFSIYIFRYNCLFVIFISDFQNTQNSFSCGRPFDPNWSVKYLNFWPKATDSDSSTYFFQKLDTLRLLKIQVMDYICKNEFLLDKNIRHSYETKLKQNSKYCRIYLIDKNFSRENLFH